METEPNSSSVYITTEIRTLNESQLAPLTSRASINLKTIMNFAALGDSKQKKAGSVSEAARSIGVCFVLLFSMLPQSQSTMSISLTQDRSDLLD